MVKIALNAIREETCPSTSTFPLWIDQYVNTHHSQHKMLTKPINNSHIKTLQFSRFLSLNSRLSYYLYNHSGRHVTCWTTHQVLAAITQTCKDFYIDIYSQAIIRRVGKQIRQMRPYLFEPRAPTHANLMLFQELQL